MFTIASPAVDATRRIATSALPDAPVIAEVEPARAARVRAALANALRTAAAHATTAAERVDPRLGIGVPHAE